MLRGTARQKKADGLSLVSTSSMTSQKTLRFVRSLSSVCLGPLNNVVADIIDKGQFPEHWKDCVHEEDGGSDDRGVRPQHGIDILRSELDALVFRNGIAVAKDDVTGNSLVPA